MTPSIMQSQITQQDIQQPCQRPELKDCGNFNGMKIRETHKLLKGKQQIVEVDLQSTKVLG